jgi:hypothetical protein
MGKIIDLNQFLFHNIVNYTSQAVSQPSAEFENR